jgi:hypothetical protein
VGLRRSSSRRRQVHHVHLPLAKLRGLPEATAEDRAGHPKGAYLSGRQQSQDLQEERHGQRVARRASEDRACVHIPKGAAWLNLIEVWWRLFRRQAPAGGDLADGYEIDQATTVATRQLNRKARPWVWGRPPKPPRHRRREFVYRL